MAKRKITNPLALAVLSLLVERPMHPYYGSLYSVVESLHRGTT